MTAPGLVLPLLAALAAAAAPPPKPASFDPNAAYDRATSALNSGRYAAAIPDLKGLKERYPRDPVVRSKLIIAYEGSGDFAARDRERLELIRLHASTDDARFRRQPGFQRDLFHVGGRAVGVIEYYAADGGAPARFSFLLVPTRRGANDGRRLTLSSSAGRAGSGAGASSLDEDTPGGHTTWDSYRAEPEYEDLKKEVIEILNDKRQPVATFERREKK